jgi:hypothetical protein
MLNAVLLPMLPRRYLLWGLRRSASHARIDWVWFIISQMAFGLTSGFNVAHAQPMATMQTWPLATRASVEAIGIELGREHD